MSPARRTHAGAAVGGLFDHAPATGGLAAPPADPEKPVRAAGGVTERERLPMRPDGGGARLRLGVELTELDVGFLRELSRPSRTGGQRTLGSKFVGTGILAAAIELIAETGIDMQGVAAGDLGEMTVRARAALAATRAPEPNGAER